MKLVLISVLAFFMSLTIIYIVKKLSNKIGLIDKPNGRSAHSQIMPSGGGVGIIIPTLLLYCIACAGQHNVSGFDLPLFFAALAVSLIALIDDVNTVSSKWRLMAYTFICFVAVVWVQRGGELEWRYVFSLGLMLCFLVWWTVLYNFMDGIDGLASVQLLTMCISALILYLVFNENETKLNWYLMLIVLLMASTFGFIVFNWPPAKIFLGDVGSIFLGFVTGIIGILGWKNEIAPIWSWLIIGAVFWVDATYTLLRRIIIKEAWFHPHNTHAYQQAVKVLQHIYSQRNLNAKKRRTCSHRIVSGCVGLINLLWLLPAAILAQKWENYGLIILVIAWLPIFIIVVKLSKQLSFKYPI